MMNAVIASLLAVQAAPPSASVPDANRYPDFAGRYVNDRQLADLRNAYDHLASTANNGFDMFWKGVAPGAEKGPLPKSFYKSLWLWTQAVGTTGMCKAHLDQASVETLRRRFDKPDPALAEIITVFRARADEEYRAGEALARKSPLDAGTCGFTLVAVRHMFDKAEADLMASSVGKASAAERAKARATAR